MKINVYYYLRGDTLEKVLKDLDASIIDTKENEDYSTKQRDSIITDLKKERKKVIKILKKYFLIIYRVYKDENKLK